MIFDTNFVIDFLNGKKYAIDKVKALNEGYAITSPTVFEVWSGIISLSKGENNKTKTKEFFLSQVIYDLDIESAEQGGKIHGDLAKKGLTIEPADCMIAGIAMVKNESVLTRDPHFKRVEGLKIEGY